MFQLLLHKLSSVPTANILIPTCGIRFWEVFWAWSKLDLGQNHWSQVSPDTPVRRPQSPERSAGSGRPLAEPPCTWEEQVVSCSHFWDLQTSAAQTDVPTDTGTTASLTSTLLENRCDGN